MIGELVLAVLAGALIVGVALEMLRAATRVETRHREDRANAAMRDALDRRRRT